MKRPLTVLAAFATAALLATGTAHADPPSLGGVCDGVVDVGCRAHQCQPDELDCGMIPPCVLWVAGVCLV
jgi:hypothetical protein